MILTLGGPGVACSTMTLRRLAAGELGAEAAARAESHLAGCARCQAAARGLEEERRALAAALPFEAFAAGVAERLAAGPERRPSWRGAVPPSRRPAWRRALPLALAASLALGLALPLLGRLGGGPGSLLPGDASRTKGGASAALHLPQGSGSRALEPGEPIPPGVALRLVLAPAGHRFAAAALLDEDGPVLLADGPAAQVDAPAFEWTGRRGQLVVVYDDRPIDGEALVSRLGQGGPAAAAPGATAEVVVLPLARGGR
jgi:hypothetical protein